MKKNSLFKVLSVIIAICICFTAIRLGTFAKEGKKSQENYKYIPIEIKDFTGIAHSTTGGSATDFPRYYVNTSNRDAARPRIAAENGFEGSNGLEIGALGTALSNYHLTFRFPTTGALKNNTKYMLSVKIKKGEGSATSFKMGVKDTKSSADKFGLSLTQEDIKDSWVTHEWEYTTGGSCSGNWNAIVMSMTAPENGASLIIDDMAIWLATDASKTNLMEKGSFDAVKYSIVTETEAPLNMPVIIKDYSGTTSSTTGVIGDFPYYYVNTSNRDAARPRIANGRGVNASNGLEIGALGAPITNYATYFRFPNTNVLSKNTDYVVSVKVKKGEGEISSFGVDFVGNGTPQNAFTIGKDNISRDSWTEFVFTKNSGTWGNKAWQGVVLKMSATDNGASLLIDDITVYAASDETERNLVNKGSFDSLVSANIVDEIPSKDSGYVPVDVKDYTGIAHDKNSGSVSDFPRYYENTASNRDEARPRIVSNAGVNNSNALAIGALGEALTDYRLNFRFANTSVLSSNTDYVVSIKVKRYEGEIEKLLVGVQDTGTSNAVMTMEIDSSYISSENWTEFSWIHKTGDMGEGKTWSSVIVELFAPDAGASVLIDDVCVYAVEDPTKTNIMYKGSLETACKHYPVTETAVDGVIAPMTVFDFKGWTTVKDGETVWDKYSASTSDLPRFYSNENYHDETAPKSVLGGVNGSYALQLGGDYGQLKDYGIIIRFPTKGSWKNNTEYEVSVKVKKTQGTVTSFSMGVEEMVNQTVVTLGDTNITDSWTEFVWKFTSSDGASKDWNGIAFNLSSSEEGATVLIDELRVYRLDDNTKTEIYNMGNFDYVELGQESVNFAYTPSGKTEPNMDPSSNKDASGNGIIAQIVPVENAPDGDYCLALGFDKEKATSNTVSFTLHSTRSGGTYKIGFWAMVVGEVNIAQVGLTAGDYSFIPYGNGYNFNKYQNGKWQYYEFIATDPGTFETNSSYRRFTVRFDAPAGSGMLIDKVTVHSTTVKNSVDYMYMGSFEEEVAYPKIDWKKDERFIYKKGSK